MASHGKFGAQDQDDSDETEQTESSVDAQAIVAFANDQLVCQARSHPYRTLGAAAGIGYILGAGVPRFVTQVARVMLLRSAGEALLRSNLARQLAHDVGRFVISQLEEWESTQRNDERSSSSGRGGKNRSSRREKRFAKSQHSSETTH